VRAATFDDESSLVAAFRGAERLLLVSTDALDTPGKRLAQHRAAIRAAEAVGVRHVVYTSLTNPYPGSPIGIAEDHRLTEAALVQRSADPLDQRRVILHISDFGLQKVAALQDEMREHRDRLGRAFGPERQAQLRELLDAFIQAHR
jgi:uncharacterized protein YbjT (DUF2867 family)